MTRVFWLLLVSTGLVGCHEVDRFRAPLSAPPPATQNEEVALINNLRAAYADCEAATCAGRQFDTAADEDTIKNFTDSGFTLSDFYCDRFFRSANQAARHRKFLRSTSNDVGGLLNAVLGVVKAGSGVSNGIAAGFAFGDSAFRNYDDSYVVDADLSKMQRFVFASQDSMKREIAAKYPQTIFSAESTILRYANLCSFLGMQALLNDSVSSRTVSIEQSNKAVAVVPPAPSPSPSPAAVATPPPTPTAVTTPLVPSGIEAAPPAPPP
jgi:hypothetical protein